MPAVQQGPGGSGVLGAVNQPSPFAAAPGTYSAPPVQDIQAAEGYTAAEQAYQTALARFNQQRTGTLSQYGYKGTVDPKTGMMTNVGVDPGNTYGTFQQLLHGQAGEDVAATNAAEERGLVGGLANQAGAELHYQHGAQTSSMAQALLNSLSGVDSQQQDAKTTLDNALWSLTHDATTSAIAGGDYNPASVPAAADPTIQGEAKNQAPFTNKAHQVAKRVVSLRPQTKTPVAAPAKKAPAPVYRGRH